MNQQHNARRTQSRSSDGNEAGSASEMPMRPGGESMGGARGEVPFSEAAKRGHVGDGGVEAVSAGVDDGVKNLLQVGACVHDARVGTHVDHLT